MITLCVLVIVIFILAVAAVLALIGAGVSAIVSFGDIFIAGLIIYLIVKHFYKKYKR